MASTPFSPDRTGPAPGRGGGRVCAGLGARAAGVLLAVLSITMLAVGASLAPAAEGHGTHRGLGLPACGWVVAFDKPCPTCGMTTAVAHAADGNLVRAFVAQPMGLVCALTAATLFWLSLHVAVTGSRLGTVAGRVITPRVLWVLAGLTIAAWAYKYATWPDGANAPVP
ncbi:MAG: DUF2752 domain-containing protein [Planctomycetota bacterium]|nr:DUF2752 domain-containing protein [Planctomycetota bacterium]